MTESSGSPASDHPAPAPTPSAAARHDRRRAWYTLGRATRNVLLGFLALLAVVRFSGVLDRAFVHPGPAVFDTPPEFEDVLFTSRGLKLHAWWMPPLGRAPGAGPCPAVLHIHGNEGSIPAHATTSEYLRKAGIGVLLFDYRGFGRSEPGRFITRDALMDDARAAWAALLARPDVDRSRVGVFGYSLGGAFAVPLAAERPEIRCVCTVATFASWPSVAHDFVPYAAYALVRSGLSVEDAVRALGPRPVLIVHGTRDEIVPYHHALRIRAAAERAGVPLTLLSTDRRHLNIFTQDTKDTITRFFADHLGAPPR